MAEVIAPNFCRRSPWLPALALVLLAGGAFIFHVRPMPGVSAYRERARPALILGRDEMTRRNKAFLKLGLLKMSGDFHPAEALAANSEMAVKFFGQPCSSPNPGRLSHSAPPSTTLLPTPPPVLPAGAVEISIVCPAADLFDPERGIVAHPFERGHASERAAWVTARLGSRILFESPVGLRIHGGSSRVGRMKSFALIFREEYGGQPASPPGLFFGPDTPPVRHLVLMAAFESSQFDAVLATEMARRLGCRTSRSVPAIVRVNGTEILAPYFVTEHQSPEFVAQRHGLADIDWFRLKGETEPPESFIEWRRWQRKDRPFDLAGEAARFDLDDLCSWALAMTYTATTDNDQGAYFRDRTRPDSPWHCLTWDLDAAFNNGLYTHRDVTIDCRRQCFEILYGERGRFFFKCINQSPEFRTRFRAFAHEKLEKDLPQAEVLALVDRQIALARSIPNAPATVVAELQANRAFLATRHARYCEYLDDLIARAERGAAPYVFATE